MADEDFDTPDFNSAPTNDSSSDVEGNVMKELDRMAGLPDDDPAPTTARADAQKPEQDDNTADDAEQPDENAQEAAPEEERAALKAKKPARGQAGMQKSLLNTFLQENETGDLVDHNNNIIAKKGPQRLYFERMKKEGRDALHRLEELAVSQYETREALQGLYEDYKKLEASSGKDRFADLQVNDDETAIIRRLLPMFRQDPGQGIKALLTEVAARGTDLKKLGLNSGTLDMSTVRAIVQEAVQKNAGKQDIDTISPQQSQQQSPEEQAERFLAQFPDAAPYTDAIAEAAQRFPQMSLPQIWVQLRRAIIAAEEKKSSTKTKAQPSVKKQAKPRAQSKPQPRAHENRRSYRDIAADLLKETQNG